jgi:hypothetical protein
VGWIEIIFFERNKDDLYLVATGQFVRDIVSFHGFFVMKGVNLEGANRVMS